LCDDLRTRRTRWLPGLELDRRLRGAANMCEKDIPSGCRV